MHTFGKLDAHRSEGVLDEPRRSHPRRLIPQLLEELVRGSGVDAEGAQLGLMVIDEGSPFLLPNQGWALPRRLGEGLAETIERDLNEQIAGVEPSRQGVQVDGGREYEWRVVTTRVECCR